MDRFVNYPSETLPETEYDPGYFDAPPRQPNLGYAAALVCIGILVLIIVSFVVAVVLQASHAGPKLNVGAEMPKASILLEAVTFLTTLAIAIVAFPRFWRRPFAEVIRWNAAAVRPHLLLLAGVAISLSVGAQLLESLLTLPKQMPVDNFFKKPSDVWVIAVFGTLVAPICEEIFFRGFLLRGIAIAYDWLSTPRTEEGRLWWRTTDSLTPKAVWVAAIVSSGLFAAMHAAQLGFAWSAVGVLWIVGGGLTAVRLKYDSVAASSVVHAIYNGWIFAVIFVATGGFRHLEKVTGH